MYEQYQRDPNSVDKVWWDFFKNNAPGGNGSNGTPKGAGAGSDAGARPGSVAAARHGHGAGAKGGAGSRKCAPPGPASGPTFARGAAPPGLGPPAPGCPGPPGP